MEYKYDIMPKKVSLDIRQRFVNSFIDENHEFYVKYIKPLSADDVWIGFGHCMSHLWSCIKKEYKNIVSLSAITDYLQSIGDKEIYIMFDILPKKHIFPAGFAESIWQSNSKMFSSDTVLKMSADVFLKILDHDLNYHDINAGPEIQIFGEDIYAFDDSFNWFVATTHDFNDESNIERICYSHFDCQ